MKKKIIRIAALIFCLVMVATIPVSAISSSFSAYQGYEYNAYQESKAAPVGYTVSDVVEGKDLSFRVPVSEFTDVCFDDHDVTYSSFYILDGKKGIVYKTDSSLYTKSVYNKFTDKKGKEVSLKGAKMIAADFSNSYYYVVKGNKIYIISSLCEIVKTLTVNNIVSINAYGYMGLDNYTTYLTVVTSDKPNGISLYDNLGKYIGFSSVGSKITAMRSSCYADMFIAADAGSNSYLALMAETDVDKDGNDIVTGFSVSDKYKVKGVNLAGIKSLSVDGFGDKIYATLPNGNISVYSTFDNEYKLIDKSVIPRNVDILSTKYTKVCCATDNDTIIALSSEKGPEISVYNSNMGYVSSRSELTTSLNTPTDMTYKDGKYIYILDAGNSRIVKVDKDLTKIIDIYSDFHNEKKGYLSFYGASGFAVDKNENFYICDTEGQRVLVSDSKGDVRLIITRPNEALSDTESPFSTTKVMIDRKDQIYVLCSTINLGAFVFDMDGNYLSFFGSNDVIATADVLLNYLRKKFLTREQMKAIIKATPVTITNFDMDDEGFVYTVTETEQNKVNNTFTEMVKKLNYNGTNVLTLSGNSFGFGDLEWDRQKTITNTSFNDIDIDDDGYLNLIDSGRGKIFQYTPDGDLVTVFGGFSTQKGTFTKPSAIESVGKKIYVLDEATGCITVFKRTEYTNVLRHAYDLLDSSDADAALEAWNNVLKYNTNSLHPYYGMGMAYEMKGDFEKAMEYFELANAKNEYSKSYKEYRKQYVTDNILWIALIIIAAIVIIVFIVKYFKKKMVAKHGEAYSPLETKSGLPFYVLLHPVDGFEQFRNRNMTSVPIAIGLIVLYFLVKVLEFFATGFAFNSHRPIDYDLFAMLAGTFGVYVLFIIANWAVCTLCNGKGRMKEIMCVTSYALTPMMITTIIGVILSNSLTLDEAAFISIISTIGIIWSAIVLLMGLYTIHQYSFAGTVGSVLLTVFGMLVIGLVVVLFFTLLHQFYTFVMSIVEEIKLR